MEIKTVKEILRRGAARHKVYMDEYDKKEDYQNVFFHKGGRNALLSAIDMINKMEDMETRKKEI